MKRRTLLRLIVSLLLIAAFVIGATIVEASNSLDPLAWYWAQKKLPLLWIVDAFALVALVPVCGFAGAQNRLYRRAEDTARTRDEHQAQMDRMIRGAERSEQWNAEQAETIAALQQALATLAAKLESVEQDGQARQQTSEAHAQTRQQALEAEARHLAGQAFASLNGQVEANTRQMEAVNLAMQYQRAEIKQLRQGVRVIQRHHEIFHVAQLSPDEQAAIASLENMDDIKYLADAGADNAAQNGMKSIASMESANGANDPHPAEPLLLSSGAGEPGFFAPTMNGQATFVSSPTAYTVAVTAENDLSQEQPSEQSTEQSPEQQEQQTAAEQAPARTNAGKTASKETPASTHVTEEEYRWLTGTNAASASENASHDNAPSEDAPRDDAASAHPAPSVPQEPPASAPAARRWRLRL